MFKMKKIISFVLVLAIITFIGCKPADNEYVKVPMTINTLKMLIPPMTMYLLLILLAAIVAYRARKNKVMFRLYILVICFIVFAMIIVTLAFTS